jgi:hypothetical protein
MIRIYENLVVPDAVDANVCPKTTSMAATSEAKRQKARAEASHPHRWGDWKVRRGGRVCETAVFIQVSVSASGFGSDPC